MDDMKRCFLDLMERFETGMFCTRQASGSLRARPMAVARVEENGDVWFVTAIGSGKVEEVLNDSAVVVTFQSRSRYVSLSGRAELIGDPTRLDELWRDEWREFFPEGRDDPRLALLHVRAVEAEYWDSSARGVRHALEAAKAALQGKRRENAEDHGHLLL
jgi:general stress protein 26